MQVINATSVDGALVQGMRYLLKMGLPEKSRAGDVLVLPVPVTTVYYRPTRRVLLNPARDANPFFHLMEALWMLSGRNDAGWLDQFVSDFSERFAEQDGTIHGAYGFRWRRHFDMDWGGSNNLPDQLETVVRLLRSNPGDRQAVITMWDPVADLGVPGLKDRPCNTHIYLRVRSAPELKCLDLTVCCRSNDIIWGAYGANAVHFSVLQEYLAARIGVVAGRMYQISNNFHGYVTTVNKKIVESEIPDPYASEGGVSVTPIVEEPHEFDRELAVFMAEPSQRAATYQNEFFGKVAVPMYRANAAWKLKEREQALEELKAMPPRSDWRQAAEQWFVRRMAKAASFSSR